MVWLTGTGLVIGLLMVVALVGVVFYQGIVTFWPGPLVRVEYGEGEVVLGEVTRQDDYRPDPSLLKELGPADRAAAEAEMAASGGNTSAGSTISASGRETRPARNGPCCSNG